MVKFPLTQSSWLERQPFPSSPPLPPPPHKRTVSGRGSEAKLVPQASVSSGPAFCGQRARSWGHRLPHWPRAAVPSLGWKHTGPSPQCCSGAVPGVPARACPTTPPFRYFWTLTTATPFAEHCPPARPAFWLSGPVSHPCLHPGSQMGSGGAKGCGEQTAPTASRPSLSNSAPPRVEGESGTQGPAAAPSLEPRACHEERGGGPSHGEAPRVVAFGTKSLALPSELRGLCPQHRLGLSPWPLGCGGAVFRKAQGRGAETADSGSVCCLCWELSGLLPGEAWGSPGLREESHLASQVFRSLPPLSPSPLFCLFLPPPRFLPQGHRRAPKPPLPFHQAHHSPG